MLTNTQIEDLAPRMKIPLEFCGFKSELPKKIKTNKAYIINLDDEEDRATGILSSGSHWTTFTVMEYPNKKLEPIYFDSYGVGPPEIVKKRIMDNFKLVVPFNTKDIQSLMNEACGWYSLAFLHFIYAFPQRSKNLYWDVETFLDLFEDLNKSIDWKKNEYILKMFFQPEDASLRKPIEVISDPDNITGGCEQRIIDTRGLAEGAEFDSMEKINVDIRYV
jgi:hypothetical protein